MDFPINNSIILHHTILLVNLAHYLTWSLTAIFNKENGMPKQYIQDQKEFKKDVEKTNGSKPMNG